MLLILTQNPDSVRNRILNSRNELGRLRSVEELTLSISLSNRKSEKSASSWFRLVWKDLKPFSREELISCRSELAEVGSDLLQVERPLDSGRKSLFAFDMDSTLIRQEVIDELARLAGVYEEVASVTREAMEGGLEFQDALYKRCAYLKGLPVSVFAELYPRLEPNKGVVELLLGLSRRNVNTAVFSGGFTDILELFKKDHPIGEIRANVLERKNGILTGTVTGEIVDKNKKLSYLREIRDREGIDRLQTVAVGDGANDALMLNEAGIGVGFHAKEGLKKLVLNWVDFAPMDALLLLFS
ncbi:phosphoserine phosphatase SerB [Leptospira ellisii]|uniref:Phosphoserine phosphatase n=1 Tax=Leptospira ellisii TaxID=2023197 RepID=A0A2N0BA30_9LEPT|nr:phosphoserine phosphatase SerB [Leptospira ellisii]MDV6235021.1 phosphoserine phosphatase SerB [Leptospira ellisii]PJZ93348.1 phosphoserine phosphatase SerB [Leptospira ellisii]PKA02869.1 phosphoserine phosphatase SerB [Leptospira ellisii]